MITNDYIMRLIKQLGDAILQVARLRKQKEYVQAHEAVGDTCDELLGHQPHFLDVLDARSAARMLGRWFKIKAYASLIEADAEVYAHEGDANQAERLHRRALEVLLEGIDRGGRGDRDLRQTVKRMLGHVRPDHLSPAYQRIVRELKD
jgi:uncharacterized protein YabN with tetrapyrrole methylase and pyrophosphatase domain